MARGGAAASQTRAEEDVQSCPHEEKENNMFALFTTIVSFLTGGIPKLLDFFQDKADKSHELAMAALQTERELKLHAAGLDAQKQIEEIRSDQIRYQHDAAIQQAAYTHDAAIGQGASQWVINARAMVRPTVTYGLLLLLFIIDCGGLYYAITSGVPFPEAMAHVWDDETEIVWASVVSFWFGTRAFARRS